MVEGQSDNERSSQLPTSISTDHINVYRLAAPVLFSTPTTSLSGAQLPVRSLKTTTDSPTVLCSMLIIYNFSHHIRHDPLDPCKIPYQPVLSKPNKNTNPLEKTGPQDLLRQGLNRYTSFDGFLSSLF